MASGLKGRLARLEIENPVQPVAPVILPSDRVEQAARKYKDLLNMSGATAVASTEMTQEQASELYYAAVPPARPVIEASTEMTLEDPLAWLDAADSWEAAHPDGPAYADRHGLPAPEEYAHVPAELREALDLPPVDEPLACSSSSADEPAAPLVVVPIGDQDDWLII